MNVTYALLTHFSTLPNVLVLAHSIRFLGHLCTNKPIPSMHYSFEIWLSLWLKLNSKRYKQVV